MDSSGVCTTHADGHGCPALSQQQQQQQH
jgi:hypothetical protein